MRHAVDVLDGSFRTAASRGGGSFFGRLPSPASMRRRVPASVLEERRCPACPDAQYGFYPQTPIVHLSQKTVQKQTKNPLKKPKLAPQTNSQKYGQIAGRARFKRAPRFATVVKYSRPANPMEQYEILYSWLVPDPGGQRACTPAAKLWPSWRHSSKSWKSSRNAHQHRYNSSKTIPEAALHLSGYHIKAFTEV